MRAVVTCLILAAASPAVAQDDLALSLGREAERAAAEQAARLRDIVLTNELSRLEAQAQSSQALAGLAAQRAPVVLPVIPPSLNAPPLRIDVSRLATIPDAALADSNAKVRAAAGNRR